MDFWSLMLIIVFIVGSGLTGSLFISLFNQCILWFCDWREGADINWGWETFGFLAGPMAWMFAILEIVMLYSK